MHAETSEVKDQFRATDSLCAFRVEESWTQMRTIEGHRFHSTGCVYVADVFRVDGYLTCELCYIFLLPSAGKRAEH